MTFYGSIHLFKPRTFNVAIITDWKSFWLKFRALYLFLCEINCQLFVRNYYRNSQRLSTQLNFCSIYLWRLFSHISHFAPTTARAGVEMFLTLCILCAYVNVFAFLQWMWYGINWCYTVKYFGWQVVYAVTFNGSLLQCRLAAFSLRQILCMYIVILGAIGGFDTCCECE